jgi:uncharacterized protein YjlB
MVVNQVVPKTFFVPPTTHSPNSHVPVIVYRNALVDRTLEGALNAIETDEWAKGGHWKISRETLAATPHFHAVTHECYTVLKGSGTYLLGKSPLDPTVDQQGNQVGVTFTARAGDVFTFPVCYPFAARHLSVQDAIHELTRSTGGSHALRHRYGGQL